MRTPQPFADVSKVSLLISLIVSLAAVSCRPSSPRPVASSNSTALDPVAVVLSPHTGDTRLDRDIRRLQDRLRGGEAPAPVLEQLGWAFVAKARTDFDAGFYKLAEFCALAMERHQPRSLEALLLRGHALHSLHRFKEAESLARQLVDQRGLSFDHGLLGDVLMEQGDLNAAAQAYQRMMDLKPDLHAYARAAHLRWLKGDLAGAIQAMRLAAAAASPVDAESAAWVQTRLAGYEFQSGAFESADQHCAVALSFHANYAPALLLRGRLSLARSEFNVAVDVLQRAARLNPLPEYQWTLAEALQSAGREAEAKAIEEQLRQNGSVNDPRTFALFLATRRESAETALRLARDEVDARGDIFTHDALAWSLAAAGRIADARAEIARALAEGTEDGRLFLHAAVIAAESGQRENARRWCDKAGGLKQLLLPSEQTQLQRVAAQLELQTASRSAPGAQDFSHLAE